MKNKKIKYYAVRNIEENKVCICSKKPSWKNVGLFEKNYEWLFKEYGFWKYLDNELFTHLTGLKVKEGKDGLIEIPKSKMKWIYKL